MKGMLACALVLAVLLIAGCTDGEDSDGHQRPDGLVFLKLVRGGSEPVMRFDPATGRRAMIPYSRAAGGDPPYQLASTGGMVVFFGRRGPSEGVYAVATRRERKPRLLGRPLYFVPSTGAGRVWLVRPRSTGEIATTDGRLVERGGRQPCRGPTLAATADALLCQARTALVAFDPASGSVLQRIPGAFPVATDARRVASCTQQCGRVRVTDLPTGRAASIAAGFEFEATYEGAFSPDGSLLAVPAVELRDGITERRRVALIDVAARRATLVPHSRLGGYGQLAWSPSGHWLFFTRGRGTLAAWSRSGDRLVRSLLHVPGTIADIAAAR